MNSKLFLHESIKNISNILRNNHIQFNIEYTTDIENDNKYAEFYGDNWMITTNEHSNKIYLRKWLKTGIDKRELLCNFKEEILNLVQF